MSSFVLLFLYALVATIFHMTSIAIAGQLAGASLRKLSVGVGMVIGQWHKLELRILPIGAATVFKHSEGKNLAEDDTQGAFNHLARWRQTLICLAGSTCLLVFAILVLGEPGWQAFLQGYRQIFIGGLSPLSDAQNYLQQGMRFVMEASTLQGFALICAKLAAFNLLPFPGNLGWNVLAIWFKPQSEPGRLYTICAWIQVLLWISWAIALGYAIYVQH